MSKRFRKLALGGASLLSVIGYQMYQNKTVKIEIRELRFKELPEELEDYRICHISDLHGAVFGNGNGRLAQMINALEADVVCMTGDMVHRDSDDGEAFLSLVKELRQDLVKLFVPGNHETTKKNIASHEKLNREVLYRKMESQNFKVLRGEAYKPEGLPIAFAGFSDEYDLYEGINFNEEEFIPGEHLPMPTSDEINIALVHRPHYFRSISDYGYDVMLSGFTRGIISKSVDKTLISQASGVLPTHLRGLYKRGESYLNITSGLGKSNPVPMVGARPEIVLLVLRKGDPELMNTKEIY